MKDVENVCWCEIRTLYGITAFLFWAPIANQLWCLLGSECIVEVSPKDRTVILKKNDDETGRQFTYDYVYGVESTQQ